MPTNTNTQSEVNTSHLVSLKVSGSVLGSFLLFGLMFSLGSVMDGAGASASLLNEEAATGATAMESVPTMIQFLTPVLILTFTLFAAIFILYVLAKVEGQQHGSAFYRNSGKYAYKNFPSIVVLEPATMLYVILVIMASILFITKLHYESIMDTTLAANENIILVSCAAFAILGGALANLYYFLNKETPEESQDGTSEKDALEFDLNRILRYLTFPFMSAGMGIVAYVLVKGSGAMLGIEAFQSPSFWVIMFMAIVSGYFSKLFLSMFHMLVISMNKKILEKANPGKTFVNKKIGATA